MLARVYQTRPAPKPWKAPANVIPHWIDPPTGLVIAVGCAPQHGIAPHELFLRGKEPASYCPGHEAPPANGFPTQRGLIQRDEETQRQARQIAQAREEEEKRRLAEKEKEQERIAQRTQEEQRQKIAAAEQERAALEAREERIAREEAAAATRREREAEARKKAEIDRRAKEAAAREETLLQKQRAQRQEERVSQLPAPPVGPGSPGSRTPPRRARADEDESLGQDGEPGASGPKQADLSGWWEVTNTIQSTNYPAYKGLRLTYRVQLEQDGDRLTGRGQKWAEDGGPVSAAARSPISVTGRIEGRRVILQFTERGARRSTSGSFSWIVTGDAGALHGSFQSTAADTSGGSVARRMR